MGDYSPVPLHLRQKLVEAFMQPLRGRIFAALLDRPGATIKEISLRLGRSPRSVRYQLEWLVDAGLVFIDGETPRRSTRERHYSPIVRRMIVKDDDPDWTEEDHRRLAFAIARLIVDDLRRAIADRTFAARPGQSGLRRPGVVDEKGWNELSSILERALAEIEETMEVSARRLEADGGEAIEVLTALIFFETKWDAGNAAP